jgi:adenylate cyclase
MNKIAHLDFPTSERFFETVQEIWQMQNSFHAMQTALISFGKYVPPHVVNALLRNHAEAGPNLAPIRSTVCFLDVVDFTLLVDSLPIGKVLEAVSEFFEECTSIITDSGGIVDKYIGDAIMAFWNGHDQPVDNHEAVAIAAILKCQRKMDTLRHKLLDRGLPELYCCAGLQTGSVLMGNVGGHSRLNYTVMGEAVNLASRLQALNRVLGTSVLVGESLYEATKDKFVFGKSFTTKVKGFRGDIRAYEPLALGPRKGKITNGESAP